jgi:two-component system chemotaxis response regulator CheB
VKILTAYTGEEGLYLAMNAGVDLVLLDLELPRLDGFSFLRIVLSKRSVPIVVVSKRGDPTSIVKALQLGAVEFLIKPENFVDSFPRFFPHLRDRILEMVDLKPFSPVRFQRPLPLERVEKVLPSLSTFPTHLLVLCASTGGPSTLTYLLSSIEVPDYGAVVVVQHMPEGYTSSFAERLNQILSYPVQEVRNYDRLEGGKIYILPGGKVTRLAFRRDLRFFVEEKNEARIYTPSMDLFLSSVSEVFDGKVCVSILTGLGDDGSKGAEKIFQKGGLIVVENPLTAVASPMPQSVLSRHIAHRVLDRIHIPPFVNRFFRGGISFPPQGQEKGSL